MQYFIGLLLLGLLHTIPLWNLEENLAGGHGDPFAHAAIGEWYCQNVVTRDFQSDIYMSPHGVDFSGNYDSPFPFILTCPFVEAGSHFQFHLFTGLQVLLILISSWMVASLFLQNRKLQFLYVLFIWWSGFYIARTHQHMTLLSQIWGMQFVIYALLSLEIGKWKSVLRSSLLLALAFAGTFQNIPVLFPLTLAMTCIQISKERSAILTRKGLLSVLAGFSVFGLLTWFFWGPMIEFTLKQGAPALASQRHLYNLDVLSPLIPFQNHLIYSWFEIPIKLDFERFNQFDLLMISVAFLSLLRPEFWKDKFRISILGLAIFYFVLSLGPEIRLNNEVLASMPFNAWIYEWFPFSVTRTPARMAMVTGLCLILLGFLFLDQIQQSKKQSWLIVLSFIWIFVTGPILNQMLTFPVVKYQEISPMKGLESIRKLSSDQIVASIPSLWAQDPSQNFHRLFHVKKIASAYLAYPVYTSELKDKFLNEPVLGRLGCSYEVTAYRPNVLLESSENLHRYLKAQKIGAFIINKQVLGIPPCSDLFHFTRKLLSQPWIKVTEENSHYVTAEVL